MLTTITRRRLYVQVPLEKGEVVEVDKDQTHYLLHVMRYKVGDTVLLFNGKDGEWEAKIIELTKRKGVLFPELCVRKQEGGIDAVLCFAPVKQVPMQFIIQKATELGVSVLQPIKTQRTVVSRVNVDKLQLIAIHAAEQSERLDVPEVRDVVTLSRLFGGWDETLPLVLGDEAGGGKPMMEVLSMLKEGKFAFMVGPEGGFSESEFEFLRSRPYVHPVGMGPRILRSDTAVITGLACCMTVLGDWDKAPRFNYEG